MSSQRGQAGGLWYVLAALALAAGILLRLNLAFLTHTPGQGDSAFYFTVAKNIASGRGIVVDYVVYFFLGLVPITHYAGDFWNPLAEILISLPMQLFGISMFNALLAPIAAGIVPAVVAYLAGRRFANSVMAGVLAGGLTYFLPFMIVESLRTEAIIFYGAFGSLGLYLAARGREHPRFFLLAALCTGLAHFTRQDGILLLLAVLFCVAVAPQSWKHRVALLGAVLAIHVAVLSPLLARNFLTYGTPLQPGPARTAFMTEYEDFHAYEQEFSWESLRAEFGIRRIVTRRLHTAGENLAQVKAFMHPLVLFLASLGAVNLALTRDRYRGLHVLIPPLVYWILIYAFYSAVASFSGPGSLPKSLAVVLPFVSILIVDLVASRIRSTSLVVVLTVALAAALGYQGYRSSRGSAILWNSTYERLGALGWAIDRDAHAHGVDPDSVVLMARDVWEVYEGTGVKTVMIPNNDLETILRVAQHYGADYMLLPAPRPALASIYNLEVADPRFELAARISGTDWRLFRLQPQPQ